MTHKLLTLLTLVMFALHIKATPTEPTVSTADNVHWYVLQFLNGQGALEAQTDGAEVTTGIPTGKAAQLWKIEGDATSGYTLTSKSGLTLYTTTTAKEGMFQAGSTPTNKLFVWQTTTNTTYADEGWVLSPKANTGVYMNQWGGSGIGKRLGLWNNRADDNQPFKFISEEDFNTMAKALPLIPYPQSVTQGEGSLSLSDLGSITTDDDAAKRYAEEFSAQLKAISGISGTGSKAFTMTTDASLAHEAYTLNVTAEGIAITSADSAGFFYALQTLKQLMPHAIYGTEPATSLDWSVPVVAIEDHPQFGHRGYMLDVARHFFSKTEVKRILDVMASYKMNRFHWHLTDDQGWRIEIPEYPKLTEVGAVRSGSFVNAGGSSQFYDDTEYGRGMYFTLDDLREIVAYAKARNIEIIPEVDLPGHMVAAVASYPELSCDSTKTYSVRISGGISQDVLNVGKDKVIDFLKCVLGHVAEVFPYQYIHLGGDECPTTQWASNAECLQRVKDEGLTGVNQLQSWLVELLGTYLKDNYGKDIVCWDELLANWNSDNSVQPVIMAWNNISKSKDAADKGFKSIVVPYQSLYLDMMQVSRDKADVNEKYQGGWGDGFVNTVETVYGVDPVASLSGKEEYCLGVQGNMWTETCNDSIEVEYQLLPRMLALSEIGWLPASKKNFINFYQRLQQNRDILDAKGLTYATHYFEDPYLTEKEAAIAEAKSILNASKPGKVGYPSQEEYDKLNSAYTEAAASADDDATALTAAIATYKAAAITLPTEGKIYQVVSASTYYKAKYVGSTAYCDGSNIRFHYTPQTEPEELWQFKASGDGYTLYNALKDKSVVLSATSGTNATLGATGTTLTVAAATTASGKYTYVPGAVTLSASSTALFSADCTGYVKTGTNAALCYPGTWYIEEVTDFTAQLQGLLKKANKVYSEAQPGKMGQPTEEAITFLNEKVISPATESVAQGNVTEASYKEYMALYAEYLAMPKLSPIQGLSEDVYYKIRNVWFSTTYAKAETSGAVVPASSGTTDGYLWQVVKSDDQTTVTLINKLTGKASYPESVADGSAVKTGSSHSWTLDEFTTEEDATKTGVRIIAEGGSYGWYTNPNAFQKILLKPINYGAAIWAFEETSISTGIRTATVDANVPTTYYDLQGRSVANPKNGVFITNTGRKVVK